jgi:phage/plasmid-like protein (TIGR03299 family)
VIYRLHDFSDLIRLFQVAESYRIPSDKRERDKNMAHNINTYIGRESAWHQLGTVTGRYMTAAEIMAQPGMSFVVEKRQLQWNGEPVAAWGTFRTDTDAFLGTVGESYEVMQHADGVAVLDALMGGADGAYFETAGVLGAGQTVWGLCNMATQIEVVPGDVSNSYLLFATSHDGTRSFQFRVTFTRVVCENTLTVALNARTASALRIRHTASASAKLADVTAALVGIRNESQTMEAKLRFLATRKVTRESLETIIDRLFPRTKDADGKAKDSTRRNNIIASVLARMDSNDNNAFPQIRGTAYNLLNGITEYADHFRTGGPESAMFGSSDALKVQALEQITLAANGMPVKAETIYHVPATPTIATPNLDWLLAES